MAATNGSGFPFLAQARKKKPKRKSRSLTAQKARGFGMTDLATTPSKVGCKQSHKGIERRREKLRRRYPEVHGKKVDWISHWSDEGLCFFSVCFTDGKEFSIVCHPDLVTDAVDLSDWKTGDQVILRKYYRRKD
jgi:hypothetical protein